MFFVTFSLILLASLAIIILFRRWYATDIRTWKTPKRQHWQLAQVRHTMAATLILAAFSLAAAPAQAGFEIIQKSVTITSGTAGTTQTLTLRNCKIHDVVVFVPTLDSGDTAYINLAIPLGSTTYTPRGWSNKAVGATEDNALIKANASELSIIADGTVNFNLLCSSNQAADRTYIIYFMIEF